MPPPEDIRARLLALQDELRYLDEMSAAARKPVVPTCIDCAGGAQE